MGDNKFGLSKEVYEKIKKITNKYNNQKFKLFGSRSKGTYKPYSDIDIAIIGNVTKKEKFDILNEFDLLDIPYTVDLVFVNEIKKEELLNSIEKEGVEF